MSEQKSAQWPDPVMLVLIIATIMVNMQPHPPVHMRSMFKASGPLLSTKILAFSAHQSQVKNMETEFEGNRKVALILSQQREEHSRLTLKELPHHHHLATMRGLLLLLSHFSRVRLCVIP